MNINEVKRFALLIDADNAQATAIDAILTEAARYGDVTSRRCYGDWTSPHSKSWKEILNKHAIQPMQQFAYTVGKNATDSALIIDAMDLLYTGKFNGFFLVSSDSDFTKLATRLREAGLEVIGIGKQNTPEAFRSACNKFIFTETITESENKTDESNNIEQISKNNTSLAEKNDSTKPSPKAASTKKLKKLIIDAINSASEDDGWANLSEVGNYLNRIDSSFDSRNYGFPKLSLLVKSLSNVDYKNCNSKHFVKLKDGNA
jgi:uncharacterized LabA/DUF88 family protein